MVNRESLHVSVRGSYPICRTTTHEFVVLINTVIQAIACQLPKTTGETKKTTELKKIKQKKEDVFSVYLYNFHAALFNSSIPRKWRVHIQHDPWSNKTLIENTPTVKAKCGRTCPVVLVRDGVETALTNSTIQSLASPVLVLLCYHLPSVEVSVAFFLERHQNYREQSRCSRTAQGRIIITSRFPVENKA